MADTLRELCERLETDPAAIGRVRSRGDKLALLAEPPDVLRWELAVLRALIADPPDADAVREYYGELCDRYRDDAGSLAQLRPLGADIKRRESSGDLPSTLVARSNRRPTGR